MPFINDVNTSIPHNFDPSNSGLTLIILPHEQLDAGTLPFYKFPVLRLPLL